MKDFKVAFFKGVFLIFIYYFIFKLVIYTLLNCSIFVDFIRKINFYLFKKTDNSFAIFLNYTLHGVFFFCSIFCICIIVLFSFFVKRYRDEVTYLKCISTIATIILFINYLYRLLGLM
jgi:hypothetical protein